MLCCFSQWFCRVSTTACPLRRLWFSGSTSRTVATARGIRSVSLTVWAEAWEEAGWWVEPEEPVEGTRRGRLRATWTALTAAGRSELWPPSLVPQSRCQSTTRTETSPSSTVSLLQHERLCFSSVCAENHLKLFISNQTAAVLPSQAFF